MIKDIDNLDKEERELFELLSNNLTETQLTRALELIVIDAKKYHKEQVSKNESLNPVSHCDKDTKDLIEHTKRVVDLIKDKSGIAVKVLSNRVNKKLEKLDSCG